MSKCAYLHTSNNQRVIGSTLIGSTRIFSFKQPVSLIEKTASSGIPGSKFTITFLSFRGTHRLFSVKYLFGEANIAYNFLFLEDG